MRIVCGLFTLGWLCPLKRGQSSSGGTVSLRPVNSLQTVLQTQDEKVSYELNIRGRPANTCPIRTIEEDLCTMPSDLRLQTAGRNSVKLSAIATGTAALVTSAPHAARACEKQKCK